MSQIKNTRLYEIIKNEAKTKFKHWPSAYASGWVVKEYKRRGGKYKDGYKSRSPLKKWFDEEWVNVCEYPKIVPCGRSKSVRKKYPYCRPLRRVNSRTPVTVKELSLKKRKQLCRSKRANPNKIQKSLSKKRSKNRLRSRRNH
jgi:hypothetical protein